MPGSPDTPAVFLDIGGVVVDLDSVRAAYPRFIGAVCREHDLEGNPATIVEEWDRVATEEFHARDEPGAYRSAKTCYERAIYATCGELADKEWWPLYLDALEESIEPTPTAIEAVKELNERPIHLGVLSNHDRAVNRLILETFGVLDCFDSITTSEAVERTKPNHAIFAAALTAAGTEPGASVMVGDDYERDMVGANAAGMMTVSHRADTGPAVDDSVETLEELIPMVDAMIQSG